MFTQISLIGRIGLRMRTKVIVADDHPLFREAMKQVIPQIINDCDILEADNFYDLQKSLKQNSDVDILLLDLHMPGNHGLVGLNLIKLEFPAVAVIMVSASDSVRIIRRSLQFGASGYIPKSSSFDTIKKAITCVMSGEVWIPNDLKSEVECPKPTEDDLAVKIASLTPQQFKVLSMIADGQLNKQIAYELDIQETTVKHHVSSILRKLAVINRTSAGVMFNQLQVEDDANQVNNLNMG